MARERVAIVGGGPGGLLLARLLQLSGLSPVVFEANGDPDERAQGGSLDLHGETGQRAMRMAGLEAEFATAARPEDQADRLYDVDGTLLYDRSGINDDRPEIDRLVLRKILLNSLAPGTVRWGSRVSSVVAGYAHREVVGEGWREPFDIVVGADGAWSRVRPLLSDAEPAYQGVTLVELGFDAAGEPGVDSLTGRGKMFAVGDNRVLVTQRNGFGHIRGYAGGRVSEATARTWRALPPQQLRTTLREMFGGWAPSLMEVVERGKIIAVRALHALPVGHRWATRQGLTLLGDAAHLMSPFSGEGVNLALADAADLADALTSGRGWPAVTAFEEAMGGRAKVAALGAAEGLSSAFSSQGAVPLLEHYRERAMEQDRHRGNRLQGVKGTR